MQRFVAAMLTVLASVCLPLAVSSAQEEQASDKFYQSLRDDALAEYQKALEMAEVERQRKVREKVPPLTGKEIADGMSGIKFLLYNKVIFWVVCADAADTSAKERAIAKAKQCVSAKMEELSKFLKLQDYVGALGSKKFLGCIIKARDFHRETRFPPFDFLRDPKGPEIIDFAVANDCITAGL